MTPHERRMLQITASMDREREAARVDGGRCRRSATEVLDAIKELDAPHQPGKTPRLIQVCAAMLGGERLGKYVMDGDE